MKKYYIKVVVDKEKKTLQIIDNGIGMTGEEVKKYINQIAFSGIKDLLKSTRIKAKKPRLSDISVWDFIPLLWFQAKSRLTPCPIRKVHSCKVDKHKRY